MMSFVAPVARESGVRSRALTLAARVDAILTLREPASALPELTALAERSQGAGEDLLLLGVAQHRDRQLIPALLTFDRVLEVADGLDDALLLMHLSRWQGITLAMLGDRSGAAAVFTRGAAAAERLGDLLGQAIALANLGYLYGEQDDPVLYLGHTERALALARQAGATQQASSCLVNIAGALTRLHRFDEARAACDEGERLLELCGWEGGRPRFIAGRACIRFEEGSLEDGDALMDQCAVILEERGDHYQIARNSILRGGFHLDAGRPEVALRHYGNALRIASRWSYDNIAFDTLGRQAEALEQVGDLRGSIAALRDLLGRRTRREVEQAGAREQAEAARASARAARWEAREAVRQSAALELANKMLRDALEREERLRAEVTALASIDLLTNLPNRRFLQDVLDREVARVRRTRGTLALAMIDVDHFKTINDAYGHAAGDEVLKEIGRRLRVAARGGDVVGRWGGEEFLIILSDQASDIGAGSVAAERFRRAIAGEDIIVLSDVALRVTVSIGVACHNSAVAPVDSALVAADRALYRAKARGRNCVEADRSA